MADIFNSYVDDGPDPFALKQKISLRVEERIDLSTISNVFMTVISGHSYLRS